MTNRGQEDDMRVFVLWLRIPTIVTTRSTVIARWHDPATCIAT